MDVRNCKGCGKLYNYTGTPPLCPACREALEKKFTEVKEYVRKNPRASITQVAEDMEVSVKQIKEWIKDDRLMLSDATLEGINCEHCGRAIRSGRFCDKCKAVMTTSLKSALDKPITLVTKPTNLKERDKIRFNRHSND